jgi:hypothetical protein
VGCVGFIAGRTHHHDYQSGMRSGGRFGTHRRTARRLAQVSSGMENCQIKKAERKDVMGKVLELLLIILLVLASVAGSCD